MKFTYPVLDGKACTTFPNDVEKMRAMFPHLDVRDSVLFVHDGKYITSAGGAKSFEAALYLCEHLYGAEVARRLAQGLVIDWDVERVPHTLLDIFLDTEYAEKAQSHTET